MKKFDTSTVATIVAIVAGNWGVYTFTAGDIRDLRDDLQNAQTELRAEINGAKTELSGEIKTAEDRMNSTMTTLQSGISETNAAMRQNIELLTRLIMQEKAPAPAPVTSAPSLETDSRNSADCPGGS